METRPTCACCAGTSKAAIEGGRFETDNIKDIMSELKGNSQAHGGSALRRVGDDN